MDSILLIMLYFIFLLFFLFSSTQLHSQLQEQNLMFEYFGMSQEPKATLYISQQMQNKSFSSDQKKQEFINEIYAYYKAHEEEMLFELKKQELISFREIVKNNHSNNLLMGLTAALGVVGTVSKQIVEHQNEEALSKQQIQSESRLLQQSKIIGNQSNLPYGINDSSISPTSTSSYNNLAQEQRRQEQIRNKAYKNARNTSDASKSQAIMLDANRAIRNGESFDEYDKRFSRSQYNNSDSGGYGGVEVRGTTSHGQTVFLKVAYNASGNGLPVVLAYRFINNNAGGYGMPSWAPVNQTAVRLNSQSDYRFSRDYNYSFSLGDTIVYF